MSYLVTQTITHRQAVCSLYKRVVRMLETWYPEREDQRYQSVLVRHRFDQNKDIKDPRLAKALYEKAEEELRLNSHPFPAQFPTSPGGCAYDRWPNMPDAVLDYWHPLEKAQYPKYFATREKRKIEYIELYEKNKQTETQKGTSH